MALNQAVMLVYTSIQWNKVRLQRSLVYWIPAFQNDGEEHICRANDDEEHISRVQD